MMEEAGFQSAVRATHGKELVTYPSGLRAWFIPFWVGPYTLDYVWFRGGKDTAVKCLSTELMGTQASPTDKTLFPSDHRGIEAVFEIGNISPSL